MTPEQMLVLGFIASAITLVLRVLLTYGNIRVGRVVVNIALYVIAAGVAIAWSGVTLPPPNADIGTYIAALFALAAPMLGVHLNFRMGHLGLGIGATQTNFSVDPAKLGLAADKNCQWNELTYSLNLIYFIGTPPGKFFPELFK